MTKFPDLWAALAAPFEPHEVKLRPAQGGRQLHYITARTAMNRLDEVLGPENWWDAYEARENSVVCTLTVRLPDGECLAKQDAGGYAGMADQGDDDKSGYSDAFKRACAKFGVARYLYRDGVPNFVREREPAHEVAQSPDNSPAPTNGNGNGNGNGGSRPNRDDSRPRTGKGLYAWTKEMEQRHEVGLLKYINGWAKLQEFPGRMIDWDAEQVTLAYLESIRKIQSIQPSRGEALEEALSSGSAPGAIGPGRGAAHEEPETGADPIRRFLETADDFDAFLARAAKGLKKYDPAKADADARTWSVVNRLCTDAVAAAEAGRLDFDPGLIEAPGATGEDVRQRDLAIAAIRVLWLKERAWVLDAAAAYLRGKKEHATAPASAA